MVTTPTDPAESLISAINSPTIEQGDDAKSLIQQKTVCLMLRFGRMGTRRTVDRHTQAIQTEVDKTMLGFSKLLLDAKELDAIEKLDGEARSYLERRKLPTMLQRGYYVIPKELTNEIYEELMAYREKRKELIETFLSAYPQRILEAKARLKDLFDGSQYPKLEQVRGMFYMDFRLVDFIGVTSHLAGLSAKVQDEELQKEAETCKQMVADVRDGLRESLHNFVQHLAARLQTGPDGRPLTFKSSTVENLKEFLKVFDSLNITNDVELSLLAQKARNLMDGKQAEDLRKDGELRNIVKEGVEGLVKELDPLVSKAPARKFVFGPQS